MQINTPKRVERRYTQHLVASPEKVLPLLCPVREADWIDGWDPLFVLSNSGVAEPDAVFATQDGEHQVLWYITRHDADQGLVEMIRISPTVTACRLTIELTPEDDGTAAEITYRHTSLGEAGDRFLEEFTEDYYRQFMMDWERRINHYLRTGNCLREAL